MSQAILQPELWPHTDGTSGLAGTGAGRPATPAASWDGQTTSRMPAARPADPKQELEQLQLQLCQKETCRIKISFLLMDVHDFMIQQRAIIIALRFSVIRVCYLLALMYIVFLQINPLTSYLVRESIATRIVDSESFLEMRTPQEGIDWLLHVTEEVQGNPGPNYLIDASLVSISNVKADTKLLTCPSGSVIHALFGTRPCYPGISSQTDVQKTLGPAKELSARCNDKAGSGFVRNDVPDACALEAPVENSKYQWVDPNLELLPIQAIDGQPQFLRNEFLQIGIFPQPAPVSAPGLELQLQSANVFQDAMALACTSGNCNASDPILTKIRTLRCCNFVDESTRLISMRFNLGNRNLNRIVALVAQVEISPSGLVSPWLSWSVYPADIYASLADYSRLFVEVVMGIIALRLLQSKFSDMSRSLTYLGDFWEVIDLVSYATFLTMLFMWIRIVLSLDRRRIVNRDFDEQHHNAFIDGIGGSFTLYSVMAGLALFFAVIQLFGALRFGSFVRFWGTFGVVKWKLLGLAVVLGLFTLAFALFVYSVYAPYVQVFRNPLSTSTTLFLMSQGDLLYDEYSVNSRVIAPIFAFLYVLMVVTVLINLFIAVVGDGYSSEGTDGDLTDEYLPWNALYIFAWPNLMGALPGTTEVQGRTFLPITTRVVLPEQQCQDATESSTGHQQAELPSQLEAPQPTNQLQILREVFKPDSQEFKPELDEAGRPMLEQYIFKDETPLAEAGPGAPALESGPPAPDDFALTVLTSGPTEPQTHGSQARVLQARDRVLLGGSRRQDGDAPAAFLADGRGTGQRPGSVGQESLSSAAGAEPQDTRKGIAKTSLARPKKLDGWDSASQFLLVAYLFGQLADTMAKRSADAAETGPPPTCKAGEFDATEHYTSSSDFSLRAEAKHIWTHISRHYITQEFMLRIFPPFLSIQLCGHADQDMTLYKHFSVLMSHQSDTGSLDGGEKQGMSPRMLATIAFTRYYLGEIFQTVVLSRHQKYASFAEWSKQAQNSADHGLDRLVHMMRFTLGFDPVV